MSKKTFLKYTATGSIAFFLIFFIILYFNKSQKCTVTDSDNPPLLTEYSGLTRHEACTKAFAICTYYSKQPRECKIIANK